MNPLRTIVLVGFGLLASSLAASLRKTGAPVRIRAVSSPDTQRKALDWGLADEAFGYDTLETAVKGADLVLLCGPISHILSTLQDLSRLALDPTHSILVSDIGSTKEQICHAGALLPPPFHFVGGHPMAGSEKRSVDHFDATLYENAYWILCPQESQPPETFHLLTTLIESSGAHPVVLNPAEHDHIMSRLSHVPQVLSTALASALSPDILAKGQQHLAGRGFRDMTRIAASPWPMWRDILTSNQREVLQGIDEVQVALNTLRTEIASIPQSHPQVQCIFEKGAAVRATLSQPGKGFAQGLFEVLVELTDQPGSILQVVEPLAQAGINILEIELAKVREGVGGTLLLGFKTQDEALRSITLLTVTNIAARLR